MSAKIRIGIVLMATALLALPLACTQKQQSSGEPVTDVAAADKPAQAAAPAAGPSTPRTPDQVLDQLLGTWDCEATVYEGPDARERHLTTRSTFARVLGGKFLQETNQDSDNNSGMTLYNYDPSRQCYRSQFFGSSIGAPNPTTGTWNEAARTLDWTAPGDYPTAIQHRFISGNAWEVTCVVKDPAGNTVFRGEYKVTRAKDQSPVLLSEAGATGTPLPPEQKALENFIGKWRTTYTYLKAEWTPEETGGSAVMTDRWVLGGRFLQEQSEHADNASNMVMFTYDDKQRSYRAWWFGSNGQANESAGTWDPGARTFTWTGNAQPVATSHHRFVNGGAMEWDVLIKNDQGAALLQMEGKASKE
jgi:hypothetical protein